MLPALLSEDLCSLRGGVDRFAMSVIWTLDDDLEVWQRRHVVKVWGSGPGKAWVAGTLQIESVALGCDACMKEKRKGGADCEGGGECYEGLALLCQVSICLAHR